MTARRAFLSALPAALVLAAAGLLSGFSAQGQPAEQAPTQARGMGIIQGEAARGAGDLLHTRQGQIMGAGDLPPPGAGLVQRGQYVVVSGGGSGIGNACLACHGLDGAGDGSGAFPRLTGQPAWYLEQTLRDYATGKRQNPVMTPIAQALDAGEKASVAAYYAAQRAPYPPAPAADPGLLQWGGVLNAVGSAERGVQACQNCHGPAGTGMPPNYPRLAGQYAPYLAEQLRAWRSGERVQRPINLMGSVAADLTDRDIEALSLYFASVRPSAEFAAGTPAGPAAGTGR